MNAGSIGRFEIVPELAILTSELGSHSSTTLVEKATLVEMATLVEETTLVEGTRTSLRAATSVARREPQPADKAM